MAITSGEKPMRSSKLFCLASLLVAVSAGAATKAANKGNTQHVPAADLAAAAKTTMLSEINYDRELCDADRSVEDWLKAVVGDTAERITWRGGSCDLANNLNPLDAGSKWCGGATIVPKGHPKEPAEIEVYFDKPVHGKPGKAYAFRGVNYDVDGLDYKRFFGDFEYGYRQKYEKGYQAPEQRDCD
jgi:hypothetical protein